MLSEPGAAARVDALTAAQLLLDIPDSALERKWPWRGHEGNIRFGMYRLLEVLMQTSAEVGAYPPGMAGQLTAARWDLHGMLLPFDSIVDERPEGEWSLRLTLSHLIGSYRMWEWLAGHWADQERLGLPIPPRPDRSAIPPEVLPKKVEEGTYAELRQRLDRHVDGCLEQLARVERLKLLDTPVLWGRSVEVTIRYYPYRWTAHLREHGIQCEKILRLLDRAPTETHRIVRRLLNAYGELEGVVHDPAALSAAAEGMRLHAQQLREAALNQ